MKEGARQGKTKVRREFQCISNRELILLDETHLRMNEIMRTTLVAPGKIPYIIVTDSSSYAACFDIVTVIVGSQVLPPVIFFNTRQ